MCYSVVCLSGYNIVIFVLWMAFQERYNSCKRKTKWKALPVPLLQKKICGVLPPDWVKKGVDTGNDFCFLQSGGSMFLKKTLDIIIFRLMKWAVTGSLVSLNEALLNIKKSICIILNRFFYLIILH